MKNLTKTFLAFFLLSGLLFAGDYTVRFSFAQYIEQLGSKKSVKIVDDIANMTAFGVKFTNYTVTKFEKFGTIDEDQLSNLISLAPQSELNAGFGYQCVGLVKAVSHLGSTRTWKDGGRITPNNLPRKWSIIATFDRNGNYDFGHTAIVLKATRNYIYVIDQNWFGAGANPVGDILIHAIKFTGRGGLTDAGRYSAIVR